MAFPGLLKKIKRTQPDLIHAHYGYSGLLSTLQWKVPVIITFHGSDINYYPNRFLTRIAVRLSAYSIFVSEILARKASAKNNYMVIPCGIDLNEFFPIPKSEARQKMDIQEKEIVILFSSNSGNAVKNYPLAAAAVEIHNQNNQDLTPAVLMELSGYTPKQVNLLLNGCDMSLMTSRTEGSPNFIKEAMACNRPIVSVDVGDVRELTIGISGCFIVHKDPIDIADKIKQALKYKQSLGARQRLIDRGLEINETGKKIVAVYEHVLILNQKSEIINY